MNHMVRERLSQITVLHDGEAAVLYDRATLSLRPVSRSAADAWSVLLERSSDLSLTSLAWASLSQVVEEWLDGEVPNPLIGVSPDEKPTEQIALRRNTPNERYLHNLALNLANDCNLACTYCYANKGLYGNPQRQLMPESEVEAAIRRFATRYDYIETVQFMGGEPSMNPAAIRRAGEVFEELVASGALVGMPRFTMVTNGVHFGRQFLDVVKRVPTDLTVSLDGPMEVHDHIRVNLNGHGSYQLIRDNVELARAEGITVEFEPTFSKRHLDCGIHLIDLCKWFHEEFGVNVLHAPPMSGNRYGTEPLALSNDDKIREYCAVTEWGVDNVLERATYRMHAFTARLFESFEKRVPNTHLCPAGNSLLSVSTTGDISPCWMYTDEKPFHLGNIRDEDFLGGRSSEVLDRMQAYELHSHPHCRKCAIQPVCFGCKGGDFHETGTVDGKTNCDYMRAMVATFVMRLFNRPRPSTHAASTYLEAPTFGERVWPSLRPQGLTSRTVQSPLIQIQRSRRPVS